MQVLRHSAADEKSILIIDVETKRLGVQLNERRYRRGVGLKGKRRGGGRAGEVTWLVEVMLHGQSARQQALKFTMTDYLENADNLLAGRHLRDAQFGRTAKIMWAIIVNLRIDLLALITP